MTTPRRGLLFHFTHVDNLPAIAAEGLLSDRGATERELLATDVGNQDIKAQRRQRAVPVEPGGVVGEYVPFYFAARSPMLYAIHMGNVPTYDARQDGLVYLVTDIDRIIGRSLRFVFTDRNAVIDYARFSPDLDDLDEFVDWPLMEDRQWYNTNDYPDRRARRMAEFLVHRRVPWDAFLGLATRTDEDEAKAKAILDNVGVEVIVRVRQEWYF